MPILGSGWPPSLGKTVPKFDKAKDGLVPKLPDFGPSYQLWVLYYSDNNNICSIVAVKIICMAILYYPDYSQHPSVLRINLSTSQMKTLRLRKVKVICSGPQSKTLLESSFNQSLMPNSGPTIAVFSDCIFKLYPLTGRKSGSWITFGLFVYFPELDRCYEIYKTVYSLSGKLGDVWSLSACFLCPAPAPSIWAGLIPSLPTLSPLLLSPTPAYAHEY